MQSTKKTQQAQQQAEDNSSSSTTFILTVLVLFLAFTLFKHKIMGNSIQPELRDALVNEGAVIVDVRTRAEHAIYGHPNSINIPLGDLQDSTQAEQIKSAIASHKQKLANNNKDAASSAVEDTTLIVHCFSGHRSPPAQAALQKIGFKKVLDGGSLNNIMQYTDEALKQQTATNNKQ